MFFFNAISKIKSYFIYILTKFLSLVFFAHSVTVLYFYLPLAISGDFAALLVGVQHRTGNIDNGGVYRGG